MHTALKSTYHEHLLDGLYVLHNPFADHPLPPNTLRHDRTALCYRESDGYLNVEAPDDFLLVRYLTGITDTK